MGQGGSICVDQRGGDRRVVGVAGLPLSAGHLVIIIAVRAVEPLDAFKPSACARRAPGQPGPRRERALFF